jgi:hypothetical protein
VLQSPDSSAALLIRSDGVILARFPDALSRQLRLGPQTDTMRAAATRTTIVYERVLCR